MGIRCSSSSKFDYGYGVSSKGSRFCFFFILAVCVANPLPSAYGVALRPACESMLRQAIQTELEEHAAAVSYTDGYTTGRWLTSSPQVHLKPPLDRNSSYEVELGPEFVADLLGIGPGSHWVDLGAGQLRAIVEYFHIRQSDRIHVTAINYFTPPGYSHWYQKLDEDAKLSLRHLEAVDFLEISAREIEQADLISDVYGALSYTPQFGKALQKALNLLKVGGRLYFTSSDTTFWNLQSGELMSIEEFLPLIEGVKFRQLTSTSFVLTRISGEVRVPSLRLSGFRSYTPPSRHYLVIPTKKGR